MEGVGGAEGVVSAPPTLLWASQWQAAQGCPGRPMGAQAAGALPQPVSAIAQLK